MIKITWLWSQYVYEQDILFLLWTAAYWTSPCGILIGIANLTWLIFKTLTLNSFHWSLPHISNDISIYVVVQDKNLIGILNSLFPSYPHHCHCVSWTCWLLTISIPVTLIGDPVVFCVDKCNGLAFINLPVFQLLLLISNDLLSTQ